MTKDKLYVLSAILLLIAVAIPLCLSYSYFGEDALKVVDSISALIGAFCGVITLLIAILLYNKYGIDQSIADRNLKIVLEIVEELKKTVAFAYSESKSGTYFVQLNFWNTDLAVLSRGPKNQFLDDIVYFKISYAYAFSRLFDLGRDPFAPKEIVEAIKRIQFVTLTDVKVEDRAEKYALISVKLEEKIENDEIVGRLNNRDMTLREYVQNYQAVKESIKSWLVNHNVDSGCLNF